MIDPSKAMEETYAAALAAHEAALAALVHGADLAAPFDAAKASPDRGGLCAATVENEIACPLPFPTFQPCNLCNPTNPAPYNPTLQPYNPAPCNFCNSSAYDGSIRSKALLCFLVAPLLSGRSHRCKPGRQRRGARRETWQVHWDRHRPRAARAFAGVGAQVARRTAEGARRAVLQRQDRAKP